MKSNINDRILKHKDHYRFKKDGVGEWIYAVGMGDDNFICSDHKITFDSVDAYSYARFLGVTDSYERCIYSNDILLVKTNKSSGSQLALPFVSNDGDTVMVKMDAHVIVPFDSLDCIAVVGNVYEDEEFYDVLIDKGLAQKVQKDAPQEKRSSLIEQVKKPILYDSIGIDKLDEESICYVANTMIEILDGINECMFEIAKRLGAYKEI